MRVTPRFYDFHNQPEQATRSIRFPKNMASKPENSPVRVRQRRKHTNGGEGRDGEARGAAIRRTVT